MKKEYFKPEAEMLDMIIENHLLSASTEIPVTPGVKPSASPDNRGEWGSLWDNK